MKKNLLNKLWDIIGLVCTAISFILLAVNLGFIIFYQFISYDAVRVFVGCVSMYTMIHLNKSI